MKRVTMLCVTEKEINDENFVKTSTRLSFFPCNDSLSRFVTFSTIIIKVSLQARKYFNPNSQAAIRRILCDWACVQRSTEARCPLSLTYSNICVSSGAGSKTSRIPKNFPLPTCYLLTGIAKLLIGSVPNSQPIKSS